MDKRMATVFWYVTIYHFKMCSIPTRYATMATKEMLYSFEDSKQVILF